MPELPEVETIRRSLEDKLIGKTLTGVKVLLDKMVKGISPEDFDAELRGKKITGISRRGKYLIIYLTGGITVVIHLRMTGQLLYCPAGQDTIKHTHIVFQLNDKGQLRFVDQRQFGRVHLVQAKELDNLSGLKNLGIEPLSECFTREFFRKELKKKHTKIKPLLLDQTFLAGVGNIYADEALFRAKVNPERVAAGLSPREAANLYLAIKKVLLEGISNKGTSIRDYLDGEGNPGSNQDNLKVYGRAGEPCIKCRKPIERKVIGGRSSHFCPKCQKL